MFFTKVIIKLNNKQDLHNCEIDRLVLNFDLDYLLISNYSCPEIPFHIWKNVQSDKMTV